MSRGFSEKGLLGEVSLPVITLLPKQDDSIKFYVSTDMNLISMFNIIKKVFTKGIGVVKWWLIGSLKELKA